MTQREFIKKTGLKGPKGEGGGRGLPLCGGARSFRGKGGKFTTRGKSTTLKRCLCKKLFTVE